MMYFAFPFFSLLTFRLFIRGCYDSWEIPELAEFHDKHVMLIFANMRNLRVLGLLRFLPRFPVKVCEVRQCITCFISMWIMLWRCLLSQSNITPRYWKHPNGEALFLKTVANEWNQVKTIAKLVKDCSYTNLLVLTPALHAAVLDIELWGPIFSIVGLGRASVQYRLSVSLSLFLYGHLFCVNACENLSFFVFVVFEYLTIKLIPWVSVDILDLDF